MLHLNHSRARTIAAARWGEVNTSYRTNRPGVYYFSCSAHGGYVADCEAFTPAELALLKAYIEPYEALGVRYGTGKRIAFHNPFARGNRTIKYRAELDTPITLKFFLFEEDCDWAILEHLTNVNLKGNTGTRNPGETFNRYYGNKQEA